MATLQQIGQSGLVGVAPTPVLTRAINHYLVHDELMNILRFVNNAQGNNLGNFQTSFVYYNGTSEATFRALGVDYTPDNEQPLTDTVMLKFLGGKFETDIEIARAFGTNAGAVANWTEQQIEQKLNAITNGFAKNFILGDSSKDTKAFDGLNKKITDGQVVKTPISVADLDDAKALKVEIELNDIIGKIKPKMANVIITTQRGKSILSALNAYRHRGIEAIEVNGQKYSQYMGIPVIALPEEYFGNDDTAIGIPVVFMYVNENDGVRVSIPMDGKVVIILPPKFENGKVLEPGTCEMACAPLFANPFAVAKCYLTEA